MSTSKFITGENPKRFVVKKPNQAAGVEQDSPQQRQTPQHFLQKHSANQLITEPSLGMVSLAARQAMVARVHRSGVQHPSVLNAMAAIERHLFIDSALASRAYDEAALPIGFKQTISQPCVVARMVELAANSAASLRYAQAAASNPTQKSGVWLEIGTGCGYQCAIMAHVAAFVCSVERIEGLHHLATRHIRAAKIQNTALLHGDGLLPWHNQYRSSHAPASHERFDAIVVAAAGLGTPQVWLNQLNIGGRLVAPVQDALGQQCLAVVERHSDAHWQETRLEPVQFVPLLSGLQSAT